MNTIAVTSAKEPAIDTASAEADRALTELYGAHYTRLVRLATLLVRDQQLAEDIVQDSFIATHQRWHQIDPGSAPAYLAKSVVNRSRSTWRHRAVVARNRPTPLPDAEPADTAVLATAARNIVLDALAALPRRQREVLVLRFYLDYAERDIAAALGISPGAVKSHASRGAAALRQSLKEQR